MNVIWQAVCFCYDNPELPFTDTQDDGVIFIDAPDRKAALAKLWTLLPVIWAVPPEQVEYFSPRHEEELRERSLMQGTPGDLVLLECGWGKGKPQYLIAKEGLFWVSSPHLPLRLVRALNAVNREVTHESGS
ncbi:hypothetical protein [Xenorhabdus griffiniae]|uniref:hypothetical protein n=1 Tax=Xenorhabdus griffiniae TaxID=351672 RepID=UPI0023596656|nr:hypothetical protein [Xenorhabdus griffiniae]MDC9606452.1 hypothetical protein [Xenorhabdus griffiniae]